MWNTKEGGACVFQPIPRDIGAFDAPHPEQQADMACFLGFNKDGTCKFHESCPDAYCNEDNIIIGAKKVKIEKVKIDQPWKETMSFKAKFKRWQLASADVR